MFEGRIDCLISVSILRIRYLLRTAYAMTRLALFYEIMWRSSADTNLEGVISLVESASSLS